MEVRNAHLTTADVDAVRHGGSDSVVEVRNAHLARADVDAVDKVRSLASEFGHEA